MDDHIADIVVHEKEDTEAVDRVFSPERIVELEQISVAIKAGGKTYTVDEVREHFKNR